MLRRALALGSLVVAVAALSLIGAGTALADESPAAGLAKTTASTVAKASTDATQACRKSAQDELERVNAGARLARAIAVGKPAAEIAALQAIVDTKTADAAASLAACALATENAAKEAASLATASGGPTSDAGTPVLADVHNPATGIVKSDNLTWLYNTRGTNGNFAGANFIHYENLNYDFMFGDGTGGLSIWSLKDPAAPSYVASVPAASLMRGADSHGPADTLARFYEGENPTVDSKRKLVFLARDPRSFGNSNHPNGRTGLYIVDVKDPWHPQVVTYHWVPAGHTATCINDCRYLWSTGPANNGSRVNGQPQDIAGVLHPEWTGVPVFVTDVRDVNHPYTYATPVDMGRNNNRTAYTHSADVDQNGIVWTTGFGGVRGYYTNGQHYDPVRKIDRWASATDPVPYAGGSITSADPSFATSILEHNSYHVTQAPRDRTPPTVTTPGGQTFKKADLQYVTQENVVSCTSTSGGGSGRFVIADLSNSYNGEAWAPEVSATNRFFITKLSEYTPRDKPGSVNGSSCSAHWFTVRGDMVAIAFYAQGVRILDVSDPTSIVQAGYLRIPGSPNNNVSAVYWHGDYLYTADYSRGVDVLKYTGEIKGYVQPKVCWNVCDH